MRLSVPIITNEAGDEFNCQNTTMDLRANLSETAIILQMVAGMSESYTSKTINDKF